MKGFIGSANIDTNSRLCMASSVAGHKRAFGSDTVPGCYEDLELADLVVLVGSNLAWCHPVLYQRIAAAKEKRPQMKVVLIDPRRTATADIADLHLADQARRRRCRCSSGCSRYLARSGAHQAPLHQPRIRPASRRRCAPPRRSISMRLVRHTGIPAGDARQVLRAVRRDRESRHRLQPGRQPVVVRHRQGQRHHQLPSRDGAHRQARHGAVLGDRPAQRHGRARGRRPRQHARRAHGHRGRRASRPRAALLAVADHRGEAGPQGRRHVPRRRRRAHQGAVDHGDQPRRLHAGGRQRRGGHPRLPVRRRLGRDGAQPTRRALPMCACPPPHGARRTAPSPTPSGASRASAASCRRPARPGPTGGSYARSPPHGAWRRASPTRGRRRFSPSTRRCPRFENDGARDFDIGALADIDERHTRRSSRFNGRASRGDSSSPRMFADGRFFTPDGKARFVDVQRPSRHANVAGLPADPQHRPRARPLAHHDAHRQKPAPVAALRRALRRDPSAGCGAPSHRRRRSRSRLDRPRRHARPRAALAAPAARLDLRADALERSVRLPRARRCVGGRASPTRSRASRRRRTSPRASSASSPPPTALPCCAQAGGHRRRVLGHRQVQRRLARRAGFRRRRRRLAGIRRHVGRRRRAEIESPITTCKPAAIALPATRRASRRRDLSRAGAGRRVARLGRRAARRTEPRAPRPLLGHRRPSRERLRSIAAPPSAPASPSAPTRLPRPPLAAARRSRRSAMRCRPAPTAAPAAPKSATSSMRNADTAAAVAEPRARVASN